MVMIRLDNHGMIVRMDEKSAFEKIKQELQVKLQQSIRFFRNAQIALTLQGRELSEQEELEIIEIIEQIGEMEVVCLLEHDEVKDSETMEVINLVLQNRELKAEKRKLLEEKRKRESVQEGRFYKGTLRSGQVLESEGSIIVLGDVNPGGKIVAKRNIIVLGSLKGYAYAGTDGKEDSFVAALEMKPAQIRIGDILARSSDEVSQKQSGAKIAFLQDGMIYIETISRSLLNELPF